MLVSLLYVFAVWDDWPGSAESELTHADVRVLVGLGLLIGTFASAVIGTATALAMVSMVDGAQFAGIAYRASLARGFHDREFTEAWRPFDAAQSSWNADAQASR